MENCFPIIQTLLQVFRAIIQVKWNCKTIIQEMEQIKTIEAF